MCTGIGGISMMKEIELWNGASYNEVVLRDRWIDPRITPVTSPVIEPDGTYFTYHLYLRQKGISPVHIGTVYLHDQEVEDLPGAEEDQYHIESAFGASRITFTVDNIFNKTLIDIYKLSPKFTFKGALSRLPDRTKSFSYWLIDLYDGSPNKIADTILPELNRQKCRALSMAFHPRLGAAATINMLDDSMIDKIFEYCDIWELRP